MDAHRIRQILRPVSGPMRSRIGRDILAEIQRAVEAERARCAAICGQRAELWRRTLAAGPSSPRPAVAEARARSNEAQYLADLLSAEAGGGLEGKA